MGLQERLTSLTHKREELERRRARVEADRDLATKARDEALATLRELGFESVEEAREAAIRLREEIDVAVSEVEAALADAS